MPPQEWLSASRGKGMEVTGSFVRRGGQIYADITFSNKAMQGMGNFAIQFNKNRYDSDLLTPSLVLSLPHYLFMHVMCYVYVDEFTIYNIYELQPSLGMNPSPSPSSFGLAPGGPLSVSSPLMPNNSASTLLPINPGGPIMKMNPLTQLQVAVKNNVDVFYFSMNMPMHVLFAEDGNMGEASFRGKYLLKRACTG